MPIEVRHDVDPSVQAIMQYILGLARQRMQQQPQQQAPPPRPQGLPSTPATYTMPRAAGIPPQLMQMLQPSADMQRRQQILNTQMAPNPQDLAKREMMAQMHEASAGQLGSGSAGAELRKALQAQAIRQGLGTAQPGQKMPTVRGAAIPQGQFQQEYGAPYQATQDDQEAEAVQAAPHYNPAPRAGEYGRGRAYYDRRVREDEMRTAGRSGMKKTALRRLFKPRTPRDVYNLMSLFTTGGYVDNSYGPTSEDLFGG